MKPGDIVVCTDARLSEGRLKEGWRYMVEAIVRTDAGLDKTAIVPRNGIGFLLIGVTTLSGACSWKSTRFRPLERKEIKDKVNSVIADKILAELAKEE